MRCHALQCHAMQRNAMHHAARVCQRCAFAQAEYLRSQPHLVAPQFGHKRVARRRARHSICGFDDHCA
eukprot:634012-Lingulodinium_polyedra.AAC.1